MTKTILFPGRFDRPHIGHVITLQRLAEKYEKVIVVVLGYDNEFYEVTYRYQVLKECLDRCSGKYEIHINDIDWRNAKHGVTVAECRTFFSKYKFDVYGTGNHKFLRTAAKAGYDVVYIERAYDYSATDDRTIHLITEVMKSD